MTTIATATSEMNPESGQKHRSGPDFGLSSNSGNNIMVSTVNGVTFDIMEDVSGGKDPTVAGSVTNGATLPGNCLRMGANYYIANPSGAKSSFTVTLTL